MIEHSVEVEIDRPVAAVFEWLTDHRNHPRWDQSSLEMEPQEPGPWREGLEFREKRKMGPRTIEFRSHVAAISPPTGFDIQSDTGPPFRGHWRLHERDGGTTLHWSCEMEPEGPRLLEPLIARAFKRSVNANFATLKSIIESELQPS